MNHQENRYRADAALVALKAHPRNETALQTTNDVLQDASSLIINLMHLVNVVAGKKGVGHAIGAIDYFYEDAEAPDDDARFNGNKDSTPVLPHTDLNSTFTKEKKMFTTICPHCGVAELLEVYQFSMSGRGALLAPDGFAIDDMKDIATEDEKVRCRACNAEFTLDSLTIEEK